MLLSCQQTAVNCQQTAVNCQQTVVNCQQTAANCELVNCQQPKYTSSLLINCQQTVVTCQQTSVNCQQLLLTVNNGNTRARCLSTVNTDANQNLYNSRIYCKKLHIITLKIGDSQNLAKETIKKQDIINNLFAGF